MLSADACAHIRLNCMGTERHGNLAVAFECFDFYGLPVERPFQHWDEEMPVTLTHGRNGCIHWPHTGGG